MTDTIFKPGQEYRTRSGTRARIYAIDGSGNQPIHGAAILENDKGWWPAQWSATGWYYLDGATDDLDLMPPEPAKERLLLWGAPSETGRDTVLEVEIQPDGTLKAVR